MGAEWGEFAKAALPVKIKEFKQTQILLKKREKTILEKGARSLKTLQNISDQLKQIEDNMRKKFPLKVADATDLLMSLRLRLLKLREKETATLENLKRNIP